VLAVLGAGCTTSTTIITTSTVLTSISVQPSDFLGGVQCTTDPGGMQSYVATIQDWGSADQTFPVDPDNCVSADNAGGGGASASSTLLPCPYPFTLASSIATPCSQPIDFRFIVLGHVYIAYIDGYEQPADQLTPIGGLSSGSRDMLGPDGGLVTHRWGTTCGGIEPECVAVDDCAVAQYNLQTFIAPCEPMTDTVGASAPAISLDPDATLGSQTCAGAGIAGFQIFPSDPSLPVELVGCGAGPIVYTTGVVASQGYTFLVEAVDLIGNALQSASCNAVAANGLTVDALCDPLTANGAMLIQMTSLPGVQGLAAKAGLSCPSPLPPGPNAGMSQSSILDTYTVVPLITGAAAPIQGGPFACSVNALLTPLAPSDQLVTVQVSGVDPTGKPVLSAVCGALIQPGQVSTAYCTTAGP
jgi:hypothetical protein